MSSESDLLRWTLQQLLNAHTLLSPLLVLLYHHPYSVLILDIHLFGISKWAIAQMTNALYVCHGKHLKPAAASESAQSTVYSCPQMYLAIQALVCICASGFAFLYLRTCVCVFVFLHWNLCKAQKYPSIWREIRSVSRVSRPDHFIPFAAAFNWGILGACGNSLRPCNPQM